MAAVEVENLSVRYGAHVAVRDVSLSIADGELFGLLGTNGAGKTSTVECLVGLRSRAGGRVSVLGHDPARRSPALFDQLGVQLQTSALPDKLTVIEALTEFRSFYSNPLSLEQALTLLDLHPIRNQRWKTLSGGQKQRLAVALAMIGRPRLAVLDELSTGLDPEARRDSWQVIETIREQGVTVLLVTHFMDEAERLCDRVVVLDHGAVVAEGRPGELVDRLLTDSQRVDFWTESPIEQRDLADLPGVDRVLVDDHQVTVHGHGDLIIELTSALARIGIVAHDLRVGQRNLDDAFVALARQTTHAEASS